MSKRIYAFAVLRLEPHKIFSKIFALILLIQLLHFSFAASGNIQYPRETMYMTMIFSISKKKKEALSQRHVSFPEEPVSGPAYESGGKLEEYSK